MPKLLGQLGLPLHAVRPGDVLLSLFDPWDPTHWLVKWGTGSEIVHACIALDPRSEWSTEGRGTHVRPLGSDKRVWVGRPLNQEAARAAVAFATTHPVDRYGWENAAWQGVQILAGQRRRMALDGRSGRYCFEAVTDVYAAIGYDLVPDTDAGAVLGDDIRNSPLLCWL